MLLIEFLDQPMYEMAEKMSDIVNARELIGTALANPDKKQDYFKFLQHLRSKYGSDYSTEVHQQAAKLARKKEAVDGQ